MSHILSMFAVAAAGPLSNTKLRYPAYRLESVIDILFRLRNLLDHHLYEYVVSTISSVATNALSVRTTSRLWTFFRK